MNFQNIAPYLQDPLVLIGFVLLLFFGLTRSILKAGIIPQLSGSAGFRVVMRLLTYGFILALAVIAIGFALKYRELSEVEQKNAVALLNQELAGNLQTSEELRKNIENIRRNTGIVSEVMRHPGIPLMSTLFPAENLDPTSDMPASLDLARQRLKLVEDQGLEKDGNERRKFEQAAAAITRTIGRTRPAIESLADLDQQRYKMESNVWEAHLPILRKVEVVDVPKLQSMYQDMSNLSTNYNVAVGYSVRYLNAIEDYFGDPMKFLEPQQLADLLAAERIYAQTSGEYIANANRKIEAIGKARTALAD